MVARKLILSGLLMLMCGLPLLAGPQSFVPKNGFVPDGKTALRVGVAVLEAIYGTAQITSEEPFSAKLNAGVWTVTGSLPRGLRHGGVAEIKISKKSGCILSVTHGK